MGNALWENLYKSEYTLSNFVWLIDWFMIRKEMNKTDVIVLISYV